jgi:hypothetical protein
MQEGRNNLSAVLQGCGACNMDPPPKFCGMQRPSPKVTETVKPLKAEKREGETVSLSKLNRKKLLIKCYFCCCCCGIIYYTYIFPYLKSCVYKFIEKEVRKAAGHTLRNITLIHSTQQCNRKLHSLPCYHGR